MDRIAHPVLLAQASLADPATAESATEPSVEEGSFTYTDAGAWVAGALILATIGYILHRLFRGVDTIAGQAELQEAEFAHQLETLTGLTDRPADPATPPPPGASAPPLTRASTMDPWSGGPRSSGAVPTLAVTEASAEEALEELARKLTALRVVGDLEGWVPLALPPEAPIYKLRTGGSCILLPRLESPEAMEHFSRRFKVAFVLCPRGEVLVLERFQDRVAEMMESPVR